MTSKPAILSNREIEVLRLVAQGETNPAIAATLGISPHTVRAYLRDISATLGLSGRRALTTYAWRTGIVK